MKKKYLIGAILVLVLVSVICFIVFGCRKETEVDKIVKYFNDSKAVKTYKEYGYTIEATSKKDKIVVKIDNNGEVSIVTYYVNGTVIGYDKLKNEDLLTAAVLIDSVGQLQGYKDGEISENLNAFPDETDNYTVSNEGLEIVDNGNDTYSVKVDYAKKIPLIDLSNFYLKPEQFEMIKEIVSEKSNGNETGKIAKLAYNIEVGEEFSYIYMGERDKLTESAYKSILSALEVMYGTDTVNKFKEAYPNFTDEKKTVGAFTIDANYQMEDASESVFKDTKIVLVTIDNSKLK